MTSAAIAGVQARIAGIQARFPAPRPATAPAGAPVGGQAFADVLATVNGAAPSSAAANPLAEAGPSWWGGLQGAAARPAADGGATLEARGQAVVATGQKYLGVPYLWGGTDPSRGLDCSGFVQLVYREHGIELPRVSRDQARAGRPVASLEQAKPGDLVAFGSPVDHIGIYMGDGKMVVAPRRGDVVKVQDVYRTPTAIRRILPDEAAGAAGGAGAAAVAAYQAAAAPSRVQQAAGAAGTAPPAGARGEAAFAPLFAAAGARHGVDPRLLTAVARAESSFNPNAVSPAGARGLMQFMPATAREMGIDPMDPAQAVDGAARLLKQHLQRFGSIPLALAAYNAGPGAVRRHGGVPPFTETRNYVAKITAELNGVAA